MHILEKGDVLTIWDPDGEVRWSGVIEPDFVVGQRQIPRNPNFTQQSACGFWVHWIQKGFQPDSWAQFFLEEEGSVRATLIKDPKMNDTDRRIAETTLPDGKWVSTVEMYVTYGKSSFETMVFPNEDDMSDLDCERYETRDEAILGHLLMVELWKAGGQR